MSAVSLKTKKPVNQLTTEDLREIVRTAVRETLREEFTPICVDPLGYLAFQNEEQYVAYLKAFPDKLPSEIKAYFVDPQGLRVRYSDYEPTPKKARELDAAQKEATVPHEVVVERLRKLGVKV